MSVEFFNGVPSYFDVFGNQIFYKEEVVESSTSGVIGAPHQSIKHEPKDEVNDSRSPNADNTAIFSGSTSSATSAIPMRLQSSQPVDNDLAIKNAIKTKEATKNPAAREVLDALVKESKEAKEKRPPPPKEESTPLTSELAFLKNKCYPFKAIDECKLFHEATVALLGCKTVGCGLGCSNCSAQLALVIDRLVSEFWKYNDPVERNVKMAVVVFHMVFHMALSEATDTDEDFKGTRSACDFLQSTMPRIASGFKEKTGCDMPMPLHSQSALEKKKPGDMISLSVFPVTDSRQDIDAATLSSTLDLAATDNRDGLFKALLCILPQTGSAKEKRTGLPLLPLSFQRCARLYVTHADAKTGSVKEFPLPKDVWIATAESKNSETRRGVYAKTRLSSGADQTNVEAPPSVFECIQVHNTVNMTKLVLGMSAVLNFGIDRYRHIVDNTTECLFSIRSAINSISKSSFIEQARAKEEQEQDLVAARKARFSASYDRLVSKIPDIVKHCNTTAKVAAAADVLMMKYDKTNGELKCTTAELMALQRVMTNPAGKTAIAALCNGPKGTNVCVKDLSILCLITEAVDDQNKRLARTLLGFDAAAYDETALQHLSTSKLEMLTETAKAEVLKAIAPKKSEEKAQQELRRTTMSLDDAAKQIAGICNELAPRLPGLKKCIAMLASDSPFPDKTSQYKAPGNALTHIIEKEITPLLVACENFIRSFSKNVLPSASDALALVKDMKDKCEPFMEQTNTGQCVFRAASLATIAPTPIRFGMKSVGVTLSFPLGQPESNSGLSIDPILSDQFIQINLADRIELPTYHQKEKPSKFGRTIIAQGLIRLMNDIDKKAEDLADQKAKERAAKALQEWEKTKEAKEQAEIDLCGLLSERYPSKTAAQIESLAKDSAYDGDRKKTAADLKAMKFGMFLADSQELESQTRAFFTPIKEKLLKEIGARPIFANRLDKAETAYAACLHVGDETHTNVLIGDSEEKAPPQKAMLGKLYSEFFNGILSDCTSYEKVCLADKDGVDEEGKLPKVDVESLSKFSLNRLSALNNGLLPVSFNGYLARFVRIMSLDSKQEGAFGRARLMIVLSRELALPPKMRKATSKKDVSGHRFTIRTFCQEMGAVFKVLALRPANTFVREEPTAQIKEKRSIVKNLAANKRKDFASKKEEKTQTKKARLSSGAKSVRPKPINKRLMAASFGLDLGSPEHEYVLLALIRNANVQHEAWIDERFKQLEQARAKATQAEADLWKAYALDVEKLLEKASRD